MSSFVKNRSGNLMIESVVAISISVVGLLGVIGLLSRSLAVNKDVGQKFVATYLAAEGIEVVKSLIDNNYVSQSQDPTISWNKGISTGSYEVVYNSVSLGRNLGGLSTTPLFFDPATGIYDYNTAASPTTFKRTVSVIELSNDELKINSRLDWSDRGVQKSVELEDYFFNWRM